jgi:sugar lactone lactonase YvrE
MPVKRESSDAMVNCRRLAASAAMALLLLAARQAPGQTVQSLVDGVFAFPVGVVLDAAGNAYVANANTNTISEVSPAGVVSVFVDAAQGLDFPEGLAFDALGNLYVGNGGNHTISVVSPAGVVSPFVTSGIGEPMGLAFDAAGNLYASDSTGSAIQKISPAGVVTVFADDPRFLAQPLGLAFDKAGNLYVANLVPTPAGGGITIITPAGAISTFAALDYPEFYFPAYLGFDGLGNLFVATALGPVNEISPKGTITSFDTTNFVSPRGLAVDSANNVYVADLEAATLIKLTPKDVATTLAGNALAEPVSLTVDGAGNIYVANSGSRTISKVAPDGTVAVLVPRTAGVVSPSALAFDANGNLFASDASSESIVKIAGDGSVTPFLDLSANGTVPKGLVFDSSGALWVADASNNLLLKVTPAGIVTTVLTAGQGMVEPVGLAFDANGNLFIANSGGDSVTELAPDGTVSTFVAPGAGLSAPQGLAFDGNGTLYIANSPGGVLPPGIVAVSPTGAVSMYVQGVVTMGSPIGLAFLADDTLYAADSLSGTLFQISVPPPLSSLPAPLLASVLPGGRSVELDTPATVFATILNNGATDLAGCGVTLGPSAPAALSLSFQATNPLTNQLIGTLNQTVAIAANSAQSFLLSFESSAAFEVDNLAPVFGCSGVQPAPITPGVDTVDLAFSAQAVADVIALAATAPQPGVVAVPFSSRQPGAFAVASVNVGATSALTVGADTGAATLPVSIQLCPTDPTTGQCLQPLAASVPVTIDADATPTFSIFITATAPVTFAPGTSRIFVRFLDAAGQSHGSTSVAVETQ